MSSYLDHQIGFKKETVAGTPVTVDKFLEWVSGDITPVYPVLESQSLRVGQFAVRSDRVARPGLTGGTGQIVFEAASKQNLSGLLQLIMGGIATTGPTDTTAYTHTGSLADLRGITATVQKGIVLTDGTVQAFTYAGCKFGGFTIANAVDGLLMCTADIADVKSEATATGLAAATYPTTGELFHWGQGVVTIAGTTFNVKSFQVSTKWPLQPRRFLNNTWAEAAITGFPDTQFQLGLEFDSMTALNYARSTTRAGGQAKIVATWTGTEVKAGAASVYPSITITGELCDIIGAPTVAMTKGIPQLSITAKARYDGTNTPVKIAVVSSDTTP